MDGNGRWAKRKGFPKIAGHRAGAKSVEETIKAADHLNVGKKSDIIFEASSIISTPSLI